MSKQREILPPVVRIILERKPDAVVFLSGSVNFGYERPESDLDICVAVSDLSNVGFPDGKPAWEEDGVRAFDAIYEGIRLDLVFCTRTALWQRNVEKPWGGYYLTRVEAVHDPGGFIRSAQDLIAAWYESHKDLAAFWEQWLTERRMRAITNRQQEGELIKRFPRIWDVWEFIDPLFETGTPPQNFHSIVKSILEAG